MGKAALTAQNVSAGESLYIDDTQVEADGARKQGFTSFWLDRTGENQGEFVAKNLLDLVHFAESIG